MAFFKKKKKKDIYLINVNKKILYETNKKVV